MMMSNNVSNPEDHTIMNTEESPESPSGGDQPSHVEEDGPDSPNELNIVEDPVDQDVDMNEEGNLCIDASADLRIDEAIAADTAPVTEADKRNDSVSGADETPASPTNHDSSPASPIVSVTPVSPDGETAATDPGHVTTASHNEKIETEAVAESPEKVEQIGDEAPASPDAKMEVDVPESNGEQNNELRDAPSVPSSLNEEKENSNETMKNEDSNSCTVNDTNSRDSYARSPANSDSARDGDVKDGTDNVAQDQESEQDGDTRDTTKQESADESMDASDSKAAKDEIDPADLEDGELPDSDEDEGGEEKEKKKIPSLIELEKKLKKSLEELDKKNKEKEREKKRKEREREKEKEKEKEKERERERERERQREKEKTKSSSDRKKRRHSDEDSKISKSKRKRENDSPDAEASYPRGASPAKPAFETNDFRGRGDYDDGRRHRDDGRDMGRGGRRGGISHGLSRRDDPKPPKNDMICSYFMQGKCQKSAEDCNFSHDATPPRKYELCKFWMMDCCAKKEKCLYLHNDFPCKFFHTGLICKQGEKCKFSHNPLSQETKTVLLKHIETAPKEILGDFPRLNRQGALNLINKMEDKLSRRNQRRSSPPSSHHHHDDRNRRTRWEHPTRDDEEKLHELMEEAGIGNLFEEATAEERNSPPPPVKPQLPISHQPGLLPTPLLATPAVPVNPLSSILTGLPLPTPAAQPPVANPFLKMEPQMVQAFLTAFPNATPQQMQQAMQLFMTQQMTLTGASNPAVPAIAKTELPSGSPNSTGNTNGSTSNSNAPSMDFEHLPKMQQEIFKRIQNMQMKKEQEIKPEASSPPPADEDWYSDEDEDKVSKSESKTDTMNDILSKIRQISQFQNEEVKPAVANATNVPSTSSLQDVDFRPTLFGDTDFRINPPRPAESFKDVDLRSRDHVAFKKMPEIPAAEIFAGPSSHSGVAWKVMVVAGVKPIDYSYVLSSMTPSQVRSDPRLANRAGSTPQGPASPPASASGFPSIGSSPKGIPSGSDFSDPRMRRGAGVKERVAATGGGDSPGQSGALQSNPFFSGEIPPAFAQIVQAAVAAAGNQPSQNAFSVPNLQPNPFLQPDMMSMAAAAQVAAAIQQQQGQGIRPPFHAPKSSWESRYQQGSGGVTPPI